MEIVDFNSGLLSAAAWGGKRRDISAGEAINARANDQGELEPRAGYTAVPNDAGEIVSVYSFNKWLFVVVRAGDMYRLKWGFNQASGNEVTFNDLGDEWSVPENSNHRINWATAKANADVDATVFVTDGDTQWAIHTDGDEPRVDGFYPPKPANPTYSLIRAGRITPTQVRGSKYISPGLSVDIRLQVVDVTSADDQELRDRIIEPVDRTGFNVVLAPIYAPRTAISVPSDTGFSIPNVATTIDKELDNLPTNTTEITLTLNDSSIVERPNRFVDIYRSVRPINFESDEIEQREPDKGPWYFVGRMPYRNGESVDIVFDVTDRDLIRRERMLNFDDEVFQYFERTPLRMYAAKANDNVLYVSHFAAGTAERLFRNFTHKIPMIDLGEQPITGLAELRDGLIAVYSPNMVVLVAPNPVASRIEVQRVFASDGTRDNTIGCAAPDTLVNNAGTHYFLAPNKRVYEFDGSQFKWRSDAVHPTLNQLVAPDFHPDSPNFQIWKAFAYIHDQRYYLAYHSSSERFHELWWRGRRLNFSNRRLAVQSDTDLANPNRTLVYDLDRDQWWEDYYASTAVSKDIFGRAFGVIRGKLYELHRGNDDAGNRIRMAWHSNKIRMKWNEIIENVTVGVTDDAELLVFCETEQGADVQRLVIDNNFDFFSQQAGFFLVGATLQFGVETLDNTKIHRIAVNEVPRS